MSESNLTVLCSVTRLDVAPYEGGWICVCVCEFDHYNIWHWQFLQGGAVHDKEDNLFLLWISNFGCGVLAWPGSTQRCFPVWVMVVNKFLIIVTLRQTLLSMTSAVDEWYFFCDFCVTNFQILSNFLTCLQSVEWSIFKHRLCQIFVSIPSISFGLRLLSCFNWIPLFNATTSNLL